MVGAGFSLRTADDRPLKGAATAYQKGVVTKCQISTCIFLAAARPTVKRR